MPTSRATRVTSLAKALSWSTIVLMVSARRLYSPLSGWPSISDAIRCERSPRATASRTRLTSSIGSVRSKTSWLTAASLRAQLPAGPIDDAVADPALAPDRPADPAQLLGRALVQLDDVVERLGDGARDAGIALRQADPEVAVAQGAERSEKRRPIQPIGLLGGRFGLRDALQVPDRAHLLSALTGAFECKGLPRELDLAESLRAALIA